MFKRALAEFVIAGCLFFAKDMRRLRASQAKGAWDPFYMQELHGRALGHRRLRRDRPGRGRAGQGLRHAGAGVSAPSQLSRADPLVDRVYGHGELPEMIAQADYLCAAAPNVPSATGLIGAPEFAAMKPGVVIINVGRGPTIVESELIAALQSGRIRGAALDVFDTEPLPAGHPFYSLDNVYTYPAALRRPGRRLAGHRHERIPRELRPLCRRPTAAQRGRQAGGLLMPGPSAPGTAAGGMRLRGTVAMVTGASRGIGRAITQALAAEGADLCLVATSREGLADVMAAISGTPGKSSPWASMWPIAPPARLRWRSASTGSGAWMRW